MLSQQQQPLQGYKEWACMLCKVPPPLARSFLPPSARAALLQIVSVSATSLTAPFLVAKLLHYK